VASILLSALSIECDEQDDLLRVDLVGNPQLIDDIKESLMSLRLNRAYASLPEPTCIEDYQSLKHYLQQDYFQEMSPEFEKKCVPLIFRIALLIMMTSPRPALMGLQQSLDYADRLNYIAQGQDVPSLQSMDLDPTEVQALLLGVCDSFLSALPHGSAERKESIAFFKSLSKDCAMQEQILASMLNTIQEQNLVKLADMTPLEHKIWLHETLFNSPFRASRERNY